MAQIDPDTLARLKSLAYVEGDRIGAGGVERGWESYLRGTRGWEKVVVDARGQRHGGAATKELIDEPRRLDPVPGRALRLTHASNRHRWIEEAMAGPIPRARALARVGPGRDRG